MRTLRDIGVVGATGQVGRAMIRILAEREYPVRELRLFASPHTAGSTAGSHKLFDQLGRLGRPVWAKDALVIEDASKASYSRLELVLMAVGDPVSEALAPKIASEGAAVIDNSCRWRLEDDVPLVVSEVNPEALDGFAPGGIVSNPNCTTMIAMPVVAPLHRHAGLNAMVASTYQAVSGAGCIGSDILSEASADHGASDLKALVDDGSAVIDPPQEVFAAPIAYNAVAMAGSVDPETGETSEERKLRDESCKILGIEGLAVSATCVRVPVFTGHSIALTLGFDRPISPAEASELLADSPGVELCEIPDPRSATGVDEVLVGRIRRDPVLRNGLSMFVSGDNLRKGAALNAVQIAELLTAA